MGFQVGMGHYKHCALFSTHTTPTAPTHPIGSAKTALFSRLGFGETLQICSFVCFVVAWLKGVGLVKDMLDQFHQNIGKTHTFFKHNNKLQSSNVYDIQCVPCVRGPVCLVGECECVSGVFMFGFVGVENSHKCWCF